jgi:hypothetical protein
VGQSFTPIFKNIKFRMVHFFLYSVRNILNFQQVIVAHPLSKLCTASAMGHLSIYSPKRSLNLRPETFNTAYNTKLPNLQFVSSVYLVSRNVLNVFGSEPHMCSCCFVAPSVRKNVSALKVSFMSLFVHRLIA